MAKLYAKIASDIRAEIGVRGAEDINASILFNWDGSRDDDGHIRVKVSHEGDFVTADLYATNTGKKEFKLATITFLPNGEVAIDDHESR